MIGVYTPEFPFEHNADKVRPAVHKMKAAYPVAIDNEPFPTSGGCVKVDDQDGRDQGDGALRAAAQLG